LPAPSVAVVGHECACGVSATALVDSLLSSTIGLGALKESSLSSRHVLSLTKPGFENGLLECAAVRERECPWLWHALECIHCVQVERCGFFRLAAREESDAGEGRHDRARQGSDSHPCDLLWVGLVRAVSTLGDHVGFEEGSFDDEVVVEHCLHDGSEHSLRNFGTSFDGVGPVSEDLAR